MIPPDLKRATWRKSSHSEGATQCVEVAAVGGNTAVRDSKNPAGPILLLAPRQMSTLLQRIKRGHLDG